MGKRTSFTTRSYIETAVLPSYTGGTYRTIPHKDVIDKTHELLALQGLAVNTELYKCNQNAEVATGVYHIGIPGVENDNEMTMLFAWSNSYDKSMRFRCSVGARILLNDSYTFTGDIASSYSRKHTGTAHLDAATHISEQLTDASRYYTQLVHDKNEMKSVTGISIRDKAQMLGRLIYELKLLTIEQASFIRTELIRPSLEYEDNLWGFYTILTGSMKKAHPRLWLNAQRVLHHFICAEYSITGTAVAPVVVPKTVPVEIDPAQIDLEDSIAEVLAPVEITGDNLGEVAKEELDEEMVSFDAELDAMPKAPVIKESPISSIPDDADFTL